MVEKLYPKYIENTKERAFDIFFRNSLFKQKEITGYLDEKDFENENLKEIYRQGFNQGKKVGYIAEKDSCNNNQRCKNKHYRRVGKFLHRVEFIVR